MIKKPEFVTYHHPLNKDYKFLSVKDDKIPWWAEGVQPAGEDVSPMDMAFAEWKMTRDFFEWNTVEQHAQLNFNAGYIAALKAKDDN